MDQFHPHLTPSAPRVRAKVRVRATTSVTASALGEGDFRVMLLTASALGKGDVARVMLLE